MRKLSNKSKRPTRTRKQPPIPINSNLAVHQQKLLAKLNLKQQHSLTSSDENLHDDFDSLRETETNINDVNNENSNENEQEEQQTDYLEDEEEEEQVEEEEEEDNNNYMDEELCSTTEYTTNDEMDLESGSISASANVNRNINLKNTENCFTLNDIKKQMELSDNANKTSIDDYLMQNLEKDEILAAKMSKFLSVIIIYLVVFLCFRFQFCEKFYFGRFSY